MKINENPPQTLAPIFIQLREIIRNLIEEGEYLPGTAIPSENKLAETYKINKITVRNAIEALIQEGMLTSVQGKGVFVVGDKLEKKLGENEGFLLSHKISDSAQKVVEKSKIIRAAGDIYADLFGINNNDLIYYIQRHILFNKQPIIIEEVYIPCYILPELNNIDSSVFSFDDIFSFYNVPIAGQKQDIEIIQGNTKLRKQLKMPNDISVILMETYYKSKTGQDIMYSKQYIRSDQTSFTINL